MKRGASDLEQPAAKKQRKSEFYDRVCSVPDDKQEEFVALLNEHPLKEQPPVEAYFEIVQEGPNKGKSGLWFLANSNSDNSPHPFLLFFEKFSKGNNGLLSMLGWGSPAAEQLSLFKKALFSRAEEWPYKGASAFWLLCTNKKTHERYSTHRIFSFQILEICELIKDEITLEDLLAEPEVGGRFPKQEKAFWHLLYDESKLIMHFLQRPNQRANLVLFLDALTEANHEYSLNLFREIWQRYGNEITLDQLLSPNFNQSLLRKLSSRIDYKKIKLELLLDILYDLKNRNLLSDLFSRTEGENFLSNLFKLYNTDFSKIWAEVGEDIILAARPNCLIPLLKLLLENHCELFNVVWQHYSNEISLEQLFGPNFKDSLLDRLIYVARWSDRQPMMNVLNDLRNRNLLGALFSSSFLGELSNELLSDVWTNFSDAMTLDHLLPLLPDIATKPENDRLLLEIWDKRIKPHDFEWFFSNNLLNALASLFSLSYQAGTPEGYKNALQAFLNKVTVQQYVKCYSKSLLWHILFLTCLKRDTSLLLAIWERVKDSISAEDVFDDRQDNSKPCQFHMLARIAIDLSLPHVLRNEIIAKLKNILVQKPGVIADRTFLSNYGENLITLTQRLVLKMDIAKLINSRNALFLAMAAEEQLMTLEEKYNQLTALANAAFDAGYFNAFYDVGEYFWSRDRVNACQAFELVPPKSCHYPQVSKMLAEHYFAAFVNSELYDRNLLKEALSYTIRLSDENVRNELMNKIAYYYMSNDNNKPLGPVMVVPPKFLKAMNAATGVDGCIGLLEELVRIKLLESQAEQLHAFKQSQQLVASSQNSQPNPSATTMKNC